MYKDGKIKAILTYRNLALYLMFTAMFLLIEFFIPHRPVNIYTLSHIFICWLLSTWFISFSFTCIFGLYFKKKPAIFFVYVILFSVLILGLRTATDYIFFLAIKDHNLIQIYDPLFPALILRKFFWLYVYLSTFSAFKFTRDWYVNNLEKIQLRQQTSEIELSVLRTQLNPHFLFNTLNNLYALAVTGTSETTDYLRKTTALLEYMINDCNGRMVPLNKEVELIKNYIELEKLRYGKRLELVFESSLEYPELSIPSMLLFTFVENAFKHGDRLEDGSHFIHIFLKSDILQIEFKIENSKSFPSLTKKGNKSAGLGLVNAQKRLDLYFKDRYQLEIKEIPDKYIVNLKLPQGENKMSYS
ncbi:MAG: histidine kinase [Bacteroidales bacterium]|nr:histidine kinase [Bacteroidales bacterium]